MAAHDCEAFVLTSTPQLQGGKAEAQIADVVVSSTAIPYRAICVLRGASVLQYPYFGPIISF
eukprot:2301929-Rhodomonas_salina.7